MPTTRAIPDFSLIESALDPFLVIRPERENGSGIGADSVEWYSIDDAGVEHVLGYPGKAVVSGFWFGSGRPSVFIDSHVVSLGRIGDERLLTVRFSARFRDENRRDVVCTSKVGRLYSRSDPQVLS
jgi:hypothetical protein